MELLTTNNVWMMVCTALVFFMHLGFSLLEVGLTRQKNAINILFKNVFIICAGLLTYAIIGFNLMYPGSFIAGIIPDYFFDLFGLSAPVADGSLDLAYNEGYTYWTDFLFQGMFAATAATIVSGAVAERIKLGSFMLFSVIYITIVYPIVGSWKWGGGFLDGLGFYDFAGSTLVHSVGGWAALIAIYLLGARLGKFGKDGQSHAIPGHNIPLATAGVFILWLGWFGFNGGSVLSADPSLTSITLVTTCLAAAAGGISAFVVSTIAYKNYDLTMFLNGILGGLVGITAGADLMSPLDAVLIGLVAGGVIVLGVALVEKLKLDDPVGAVAVHLACGIWGTLAVGIFGSLAGFNQLLIQLAGVGIIGAFCCITAFGILSIIKATMGLRMEEKEETEGLDAHEHGMDAYAEFGTVQER
ncbi:ammonium transporter [Salegentibacter salinarum]|uniref:Ammonium transporter n=1 Tax=Salegentibacter salinarum TaxID=447422 RepID=A0A2N0TTW0_9FLAO|nr:ammonium transporter [Salegentibacter salinarum]PKD18179.1 ammonium transporter [Salegentibacter salinarum]SKB42544.1 ammonium transporter, Amt family [Salegentibacter salinarum]